MNILVLEMVAHIKAARRKNMTPAFRLNGTSDIPWERKRFDLYPDVREQLLRECSRGFGATHAAIKSSTDGRVDVVSLFPQINFYDYTALVGRLGAKPANYHLTFSLKENNEQEAVRALELGHNVAVVFNNERPLPKRYTLGGYSLPVTDGDEHDYRPLDPSPCIVGLKAKGAEAKADASGFVRPAIGYASDDALLAA